MTTPKRPSHAEMVERHMRAAADGLERPGPVAEKALTHAVLAVAHAIMHAAVRP